MLGEELDISLRDHTPIGHHNHTPYPESVPKLPDALLEGLDVCRVSWQDLPGHGPSLCVDRHTDHHLGQIRSPVPRVSPPAIWGLFIPVDVGRGGIEEDEVELLIEKVEIAEEQLPFKLMPDIVQEACGTIQMLELESVKALALHCLEPPTSLQVTSGLTESLKGQSKGRTLHVKAKLSLGSQRLDDPWQALLLPQPPKDQGGAPGPGLAGGDLGILALGYHPKGFGESRKALDQRVYLTGGLEVVQTPEGGDDPLAHG